MDLERCPKCGRKWVAGLERCTECGYQAIGAGLKNAPKKKKKKAGKYVEPGNSRGILLLALIGGLAFGCYKYRPWEDDWELVRTWFGKGRHHSVVGEWEIVKTLRLKKDKPPILGQANIQTGMLNFSKAGGVKMVFNGQAGKATANGKYVVDGILVAMNGVTSSSEIVGLPKTMQMKLAWTGPDQVIASVGDEAVYLRRHTQQNGLVKLMKYGLSNGKSGEAPAAMTSAINGMKDSFTKELGD